MSVSPEAARLIHQYLEEQRRPSWILQELRDDPNVPDFGDDISKEETERQRLYRYRQRLQRTRQAVESPDTSNAWSFSEAENIDDAALALTVLAHINKWSDGNVTYLTHPEADLIIRIRKACPRMLLHDVWHFTQEYLVRRTTAKETDDWTSLHELDVFISYIRRDHEPGDLLEPVTGDTVTLAEKKALQERDDD